MSRKQGEEKDTLALDRSTKCPKPAPSSGLSGTRSSMLPTRHVRRRIRMIRRSEAALNPEFRESLRVESEFELRLELGRESRWGEVIKGYLRVRIRVGIHDVVYQSKL